jgi:hypothetical protein
MVDDSSLCSWLRFPGDKFASKRWDMGNHGTTWGHRRACRESAHHAVQNPMSVNKPKGASLLNCSVTVYMRGFVKGIITICHHLGWVCERQNYPIGTIPTGVGAIP